MTCCAQCQAFAEIFDARMAERDLRRYRRKGPHRSTRATIADASAAYTDVERAEASRRRLATRRISPALPDEAIRLGGCSV